MTSKIEGELEHDLSVANFRAIEKLASPSGYTRVIECGVYKGYSCERLRLAFPSKYDIWGFDSFEGLPEDWVGAPSHCSKGCFSTGGMVPVVEGVTLVKGWFSDTLPKFVDEHPEGLAFLFIDCDLFNSTLQAMSILNPVIKPGTLIAFDEYYYTNGDSLKDDHEKEALEVWVDQNNREVEQLPFENGQMILKNEKALFIVRA